MSKQQLLLVDGHGLAFRGFYALPEMTSKEGIPTNAIMGFFSMLLKATAEWKPDHVALFFDPKGRTARKELYEQYKEGRKPTPEAFKVQLPLILELAQALGYPVFVREGIEADDLIAATAKNAATHGMESIILSADKDMFQFVEENVVVARPSKGVSEMKRYDRELFIGEYGFEPESMADYLALVGDAVDNIPGIPGIGDKTAKQLLIEYKTLEGIYDSLQELSAKRKALFEEYRERAFWGRSLVLPVETDAVPLPDLCASEIDAEKVRAMCRQLGLKNLEQRFLGKLIAASERSNNSVIPSLEVEKKRAFSEQPLQKTLEQSQLALVFESSGLYPMRHVDRCCLLDRAGGYTYLENEELVEALTGWRGDLLLANYKEWCAAEGELPSHLTLIDVHLWHYLLHPDLKHAVGDVNACKERTLEEKGAELFDLAEQYRASSFGPTAFSLMQTLELPLTPVLVRMEKRGFRADKSQLQQLESDLNKKIGQIEESIYALAGEPINLNSPKQVGELLFNRLRLPVVRKTKTGYSTDALVLEELSQLPEPLCAIPRLMLEYRELSKLQQSFVVPYIRIAENHQERVRATFEQTGTGTGRLSSHDPNVQTLPLFGEWATRFRGCLVPIDRENCFVAADYSQIELRVLAHLCKEERLLEAFANNRDIHTETASWVFGLDGQDVTAEQRRFAKVVNFGLLYGMSAHGLAQRMGINRPEAARIVERYFKVLPRVEAYLKENMQQAKEVGYTRSLFGRMRPLSEAGGAVFLKGGALERVAVNTPIQSAAADITRLAMVRLDKTLQAEFPSIYQISQVHDSIVCECPRALAEDFSTHLVRIMEADSPLDIPLRAESKWGLSMAEM